MFKVHNLHNERIEEEIAIIDNSYGPEIITEIVKYVEKNSENRGKIYFSLD